MTANVWAGVGWARPRVIWEDMLFYFLRARVDAVPETLFCRSRGLFILQDIALIRLRRGLHFGGEVSCITCVSKYME